jgi:hypothetical protein
MKVKIGNKTTTLPKNVVVAHMANLLASRAVILKKERDFKSAFLKYKNLCGEFLRENKNFIYVFGSEDWLDKFLEFEATQHSLILQEVYFQFSDSSYWSIPLNDIVNLKILSENLQQSDKMKLLSDPVSLAVWAQEKLTWDQVKDFAIIRDITGKNDEYNQEWPAVQKKIIVYSGKPENPAPCGRG